MAQLTPDAGSIKPREDALQPDPGSVRPIASGASAARKPKPADLLAALKPGLSKPLINQITGRDTTGAIMDLLGRPGAAAQSGLLHGPGAAWNALVHGRDPRRATAENIELARRLTGSSAAEYAAQPEWRRRANEFATQMITDPTFYLGGSGALKDVAATAAEHALPAVARAGSAIRRVAPAAAHPTLEKIGNAAKWIHAATTYGGPLKQSLAASKTLTPARQALRFAQVAAAKGGGAVEKGDLSAVLMRKFDAIVNGLNDSDQHRLYVAINNGTEHRLPVRLRGLAQQFSDLTDSVAHLSGSKGLRKQLASQGFQLPQDLARFDVPGRAAMTTENYRKAYLPLAHQGEAAQFMDELQARFGPTVRQAVTLNPNDRFLMQREAGRVSPNNEIQRLAVQRRLESAARAYAARGAQQRVASAFGTRYKNVPAEARSFLESDDVVSGGKTLDAIKRAVDLQKQGLFMLPFRHMGNISFLQALHYPEALPGTLSRFAKLGKFAKSGDAAGAHALLHDATSVGMAEAPSVDRTSQFADWLDKLHPAKRSAIAGAAGLLSGIGDDPLTALLHGAAGAVAGAKAPNLYRWSNKVLWRYDDAAKSAALETVAQKIMKQGHSRADALALAAKEVGDRLVNYSQRSPLTKGAAFAEPFATWRTKLPGVIARAVAEHPERINALGRLFPAATGATVQPEGGPAVDDKGKPLGIRSYNPFTDVAELADDPAAYAKSSLSAPSKVAAALVEILYQKIVEKKKHAYPHFTSGKNPAAYLGAWPIEGIPGGDQLLNATGHGLWPARDFLMDLIGGQTGLRMAPVKKP